MTRAILPTGRITPSKIGNAWEGTPAEGSRLTVEQLAGLAKLRRRVEDCDIHVCRVRYEWPTPETGLDAHIPCPIVARTRDGLRVKIILPNGAMMWRNQR